MVWAYSSGIILTPLFFRDKPVDRLIDEGIEAEHLNDNILGRAFDKIYSYGPEALYSQLSIQAIKRLGMSNRFVHLDSTSFHVDGVYNRVGWSGRRMCHSLPKGIAEIIVLT